MQRKVDPSKQQVGEGVSTYAVSQVSEKAGMRIRAKAFIAITNGIQRGKTDQEIVAYLRRKCGMVYSASGGVFTYQGVLPDMVRPFEKAFGK